jgi:hypothetical protein
MECLGGAAQWPWLLFLISIAVSQSGLCGWYIGCSYQHGGLVASASHQSVQSFQDCGQQ